MTGQWMVFPGIVGGAVLYMLGWEVVNWIGERKRVAECPHPEHRIYAITSYYCDECQHEVFPVLEGEQEPE